MRLAPAQAGITAPAAIGNVTQQFEGASSPRVQGTIHRSIEAQVRHARRAHLHHLAAEHHRYLAHLAAVRRAEEARRRQLQAAEPPVPAAPAVPLGSLQQYAASLAHGEFSCVDAIFTRESGWRWNAYNPSGAYGIPQALPGSKMASAGADWQTNPYTQIRWGITYMDSVYGSPCGAWAHWESHGSY